MSNESDFDTAIDQAVQEYNQLIAENMQMAVDVIAGQAKINVKVDSGALKADIKTEVEVEGDQIVGRVGNTLDYAVYHHQGTGIYAAEGNGRKTPWSYTDPKTGEKIWTHGSKPNPYLKNAVESEAGKVTKLLGGG